MQTFCIGILFPDIKIRLDIYSLYSVKGDNIKFPRGAVVFDRVAGSSNDPAFRYRVCAEGFILEELQHSRYKSFGDTVDFINKENSLFAGSLFHFFINRGNDLTHCIFCYGVFFSLKILFYNYRKSDCTLARMVCDSVGNETDLAFLCDLFHNCSFADTRRSDKQQRTLAHSRHKITPMCILSGVNLYRVK